MRQHLTDRLRFLLAFLAHPRRVGAVLPTSRAAVRDMLDLADVASARLVVELGSGTGGSTGEILARLKPGARLVALEIDPRLAGLLRERYDDVEPRMNDLEQLQTIAASHESRAAFLSSLALEPPAATRDLAQGGASEDDVLVLSTVHSAKGKEWDAVFVIWAVDGWFPSSRALRSDDELEEERRLMYVALTRARNHLCVVYPLNTYGSRWGADYSIDQLSRFIDAGVRERMRRMVAYPAEETTAESVSSPPLDLRALLRGRFGGG